MRNQLEMLDILTIINFYLNLSDVSNGELLKELQKQDKEYLDKIIEQNNKIIELLERR